MTTEAESPVEGLPVRGLLLTASELEGVAPTAEWSRWIAAGKAPDSNDGAGFRSSWRDDLAQLADLGVTEMAITLEWARLWPTADSPDVGEVEFRRDLLSLVAELGMTPWACLVDGTLPGWFADDERGFTDDRSRELLWPRHVDWVGETFGDLAGGWIPMREARQWAAWGNLVGATPPGKQRRRDMQKVVDAAGAAELEAERLLRGSAPIATYVTGRTVLGEHDNVKARPHAEWLDARLSKNWLDDVTEGRARDAFDRIIVQLRPGIVVDGDGAWRPLSGGDEPDALLAPLEAALASAGDRSVIAAGDLAAVSDDEVARIDHLRAMVESAGELGADGWWQTSPIDGWHWQRGFTVRPGVVTRDREMRQAAGALRQH